jgi:hypothetical protein
LKQNPGRSYRECRDAVAKAGHFGVDRAMVAEVARQTQAQAKKGKPKKPEKRKSPASAEFRRYVPRAPEAVEVLRVQQVVCEACGLVVNDNGYCRCG